MSITNTTTITCDRCGTERRYVGDPHEWHSEATADWVHYWGATASPLGFYYPAGALQVLCPGCLTDEERAELERQLYLAVKDAFDR
jgi:hypothetical protein